MQHTIKILQKIQTTIHLKFRRLKNYSNHCGVIYHNYILVKALSVKPKLVKHNWRLLVPIHLPYLP